MHASLKRVIEDEHITWVGAALELVQDGLHGVGESAHVEWDAGPLGHQPPLPIADAGGEVHGVLGDVGAGGADHRDGHLVGHRQQGVIDDLQRERIQSTVCHIQSSDHPRGGSPILSQALVLRQPKVDTCHSEPKAKNLVVWGSPPFQILRSLHSLRMTHCRNLC